MIETPPVITINPQRRRPSAAQIAAFAGQPTGFVADAMGGGGALDQSVAPLITDGSVAGHMAGPALTADNGPADVLASFCALPSIQPGDVLIAGANGHRMCAAGGDRLMGMIRNCAGIGLVTDGPVRDYDGIVAAGLPVWCAGLTPASPFSSGPGRVGFGLNIAGQLIQTGDMIVADRDGVVVVPFDRIDTVIARLATIQQHEDALDQRVADGLKAPDWVTALLAKDHA